MPDMPSWLRVCNHCSNRLQRPVSCRLLLPCRHGGGPASVLEWTLLPPQCVAAYTVSSRNIPKPDRPQPVRCLPTRLCLRSSYCAASALCGRECVPSGLNLNHSDPMPRWDFQRHTGSIRHQSVQEVPRRSVLRRHWAHSSLWHMCAWAFLLGRGHGRQPSDCRLPCWLHMQCYTRLQQC